MNARRSAPHATTTFLQTLFVTALAALTITCAPRGGQISPLASPEERWIAAQYPDSIREWDDEQGFLAGDVFRLPARIVANPYAYENFRNPADIARVTNGVLIALLEVDDPEAGNAGNPYTRLTLQPGLNCIWLERVREAGNDRWKSYVTKADSNGRCVPAAATNVARFDVDMAPAPQGDATLEVARFTRDTGGNTIFGFKCGPRWCDVVPGGSGTAAPSPGEEPGAPGGSEWKNKSRHDEEMLAVRESGQLKSSVSAAIVPRAGLKGLKIKNGDFNDYVTVATIRLAADPPSTSKYWSQWGLRGDGRNEIQVKLDPATGEWFAQNVYTKSDGTVSPEKPLNIAWHRHGRKHHGHGRAHWIWDPQDQRGWIDCDAGCCDVTGKQ